MMFWKLVNNQLNTQIVRHYLLFTIVICLHELIKHFGILLPTRKGDSIYPTYNDILYEEHMLSW